MKKMQKKSIKKGVNKNKIYAIVVLIAGLLSIKIDNDITIAVLFTFISLMMFFDKKN